MDSLNRHVQLELALPELRARDLGPVVLNQRTEGNAFERAAAASVC